jgi:hypothetical protein
VDVEIDGGAVLAEGRSGRDHVGRIELGLEGRAATIIGLAQDRVGRDRGHAEAGRIVDSGGWVGLAGATVLGAGPAVGLVQGVERRVPGVELAQQVVVVAERAQPTLLGPVGHAPPPRSAPSS